MPNDDAPPPDAPVLTREELIVLVARAHADAPYAECTLAGQSLAAQSRLPGKVAVNLGAGFGQWEFFPEAAEVVDFACAYRPPTSEEELFALTSAWAADDAADRHTLLALVGRDILKHESRRLEVARLRELFEETRPAAALALRKALGLEVPVVAPPAAPKRKARAAPPASGEPAAPRAERPAPAPKQPIPTQMPRPARVAPAKRAPAPPPRKFTHPKFGAGVLERQDGAGDDCKLTIKFADGTKTLLARFVTEVAE